MSDHEAADSRKNRKYAVSANRDRSHQRVRYVETGGAAVDTEECVFCEVTPVVDVKEDDKAGATSR